MDDWYETIFDLVGDRSAIVLAAIVFLSVAGLAFLVMAGVHSRSAVKRRAAGINAHSGTQPAGDQTALRQSSSKAVQRILDYASKHYAAGEKSDAKPAYSRGYFRPARGCDLFCGAHGSCYRACSGVVFRVAALGSTRRFGFLASRVGRRSPGISGAGALHQPTDFDATCRASHWISGFHGFAGGLR